MSPFHACLFINYKYNSGRKVLQDLNNQNEERITVLEDMLKESQEGAGESERKFDEVGHPTLNLKGLVGGATANWEVVFL